MVDQQARRDPSARVQVIVAVIGLAGVMGAALIANWDKIFPRQAGAVAPVSTASSQPEPAPRAEHPVHSSGGLLIGPGHFFDFDSGIEQIAGADLLYEHKFEEGQGWFLTPQNGAAFYVVGPAQFESVRWSDMERFPYSTEKIVITEGPSNRVPAGTVIAYKTNEGRLGKLIVDRAQFGYALRWRTYD